jgi:hypothetical protein
MSLIMPQAQELVAFCHTCPAPQEVTTFMHTMGFQLVFQMPAYLPSATSAVAPLPAQFHYELVDGMSIIYLAGQDRADEAEERLPPHASRWWAYAGADLDVFSRVTYALAITWSCSWRRPSHACQDVA